MDTHSENFAPSSYHSFPKYKRNDKSVGMVTAGKWVSWTGREPELGDDRKSDEKVEGGAFTHGML